MVYTEIIFALLILMLLIVMIFGTIPLQNETLNEAIRQEKAQIMVWETVDATYLQNRPDHFNVDFEVEVDGHKYLVTINALKYERPEK